MPVVDLNCDLGESFGAYQIGMDEEVLPYITSANIACGYHGGDPVVMAHTVKLCRENKVRAGAHPGFPDLVGFGRRNMSLSPEEIRCSIMYQIGALKAMCNGAGIELNHVKPHGALYNMAAKDYSLAMAVCQGIQEANKDLKLLALSGSEMLRAAKELGVPFASEVFADRSYQSDGTLVPRTVKGAMIEDEDAAVNRVIRMVQEGRVVTLDGEDISIEVDSICVHGDGKKALDFVKKIRKGLEDAGVEVKGF